MNAPLVLAQTGSSLRDMIDLALSPIGLPIEPVVETNSMEMLKKLVKNGTGISFHEPARHPARHAGRRPCLPLPLSDTHVRNQPLKLVSRMTFGARHGDQSVRGISARQSQRDHRGSEARRLAGPPRPDSGRASAGIEVGKRVALDLAQQLNEAARLVLGHDAALLGGRPAGVAHHAMRV